ncbi:hypothetical protein JAAARDRAFT_35675 [Jaapia argillacea MUCL 33604]|uniref:F-box domain-containing protein n=1 Tax=Jaapia argillacea MUCL 33604 TaxID=933084 RepID=A0A067PQP4_9AGAM|nr:hypothetical protein JAAARDRAFT_35675 [Jaapia argillacea MUCL 33604]
MYDATRGPYGLAPPFQTRSIHGMPLDVQFLIIQFLDIDGILNFRATCKLFHRLGQTRSVWQHAIKNILDGTNPSLSASLDSLPVEELRAISVKVARLDMLWSTPDVQPVIAHQLQCDVDVSFVRLLPGGEWMLFVRNDGALSLRFLGINVGRETVSLAGAEMSLNHLTCDLFPSAVCGCMILLTGQDDANGNHLFLYGVEISPTQSSLSTLVAISIQESILAATVGSDLVVFACSSGEDEFVVARTYGDNDVAKQVVISVDCTEAFVDCTFLVLRDQQLLVCSSDGFFIFDIPPLQPVHPDSPNIIVAVSASWSLSFQIMVYPPVVGPFTTNQYERPVVILDQHDLHILFPSTSPSFRTIPLPIRNDADITSVGSRRAIWWNALDTPMVGFNGFRIRTCTFPVVFGDDDLEQASVAQLGVKVGGLLVHLPGNEKPESLSFDEWSGRVCIVLQGGVEGRRIIILNILV